MFDFQLSNIETIVLGGIVTNHPLVLDKKHIHTMPIKSFDRLSVETYDEIYRLGTINKLYLEYLKNEGIRFNKNNPLKIAV